jgi:TolB-like protein/Flp pilus assembly protein TadD
MLRLTTLGTVGLSAQDSPVSPNPILAQPKRLALLAYLAVSRPGSRVFRDRLLALLWPDHDDDRARRSLRQTLYHLRRELGENVIVGGGQGSVAVDPDRLWCDAVAFERAIIEDRLEAAVDLYGGDFMAGFHLGGSGVEFERWLEETRGRLRCRAEAAASALIRRAEEAGDRDRAIRHARWLAEVLPCDERAGRTLIRLLAESGDRGGAVSAYRALADRLGRELELEPDADTSALLSAVRAGTVQRAREQPHRVPVPRDKPARSECEGEHSLAVLPFASLSGTAAEERFSDGLTEMVITELARITSIAVVSRTSIQRYRGGEHSLAAVAEELGVDRVVEGTVLESGDRVRATAQLLSTPPERHIWAESFEREVADPLTTQAELAGAIARAVKRALGRTSRDGAGSASPAARDAYLRGRCQFVRMTPAGAAEAIRQFQEAIRLDPEFAPAHAALAYAVCLLARTGRVPPHEAYGQARRRAERALALDPGNAEAHITLGICATVLDHDWLLAERHLTRGLERGPDLPESYWIYSYYLCVTGRHEEAWQAARRARELDPMAPTVWLNEVLVLAATGQAAEALVSATELAAFHRDSSASAFAQGVALEVTGDHEGAARSFGRALELGGGPHSTAARAHNLVYAGRPDEARRLLQELQAMDDCYVPPTCPARIHAALGEADEAFQCLDRAVAVRDDWLLLMDGWPRFEGIRDDPRFAALRQRVGLPAQPAARPPGSPGDEFIGLTSAARTAPNTPGAEGLGKPEEPQPLTA